MILINIFVFKDFGFDKLVLVLQIGLGTITQALALIQNATVYKVSVSLSKF